MKELSQIQGNYSIEDSINFFGFIIKYKARLLLDSESTKPRYVLDEENIGFEVVSTPPNETTPGPDRIEELARVVDSSVRKAIRRKNAQ